MTRTRDERFTERHVPPAWQPDIPDFLTKMARRDAATAERVKWCAEHCEGE